ncbi:hypothetical protein [Cerasicoccus fimbriatus]|uniref:hypothetical protein n=1 Tax=Cerasicoccus fimbriatus TaxID=3014554 RepID=UPI0022B46935|nr:hypothetical protein [Cerasicoccus sp. TK19100]
MKPDDQPTDPLDALLSRQPVKPKADFAERTLARLDKELAERPEAAAFDAELDALLAAQPLKPSAELTDKVLAEISADQTAQPEENKIIGFPSWVVALGSIAALMVLGMFSFITLFDYAKSQKQPTGPAIVQNDASAQTTSDQTPETTTTQPDTETEVYVASVESSDIPLPGNAMDESTEIVEFENVLTLDETLDDILLLADLETLDSLQAFLN